MLDKLTAMFVKSAGILLLAAVSMLWIANWANASLTPPGDPAMLISLRMVAWIGGALALLVALLCLFGGQADRQTMWVAWLATNLGAYGLGLVKYGVVRLDGFFINFQESYGLSPRVMSVVVLMAGGYLLLGSYGLLIGRRLETRMRHKAAAQDDYAKISCPECGGHIAFPASRLGEIISCPHCSASVRLGSD